MFEVFNTKTGESRGEYLTMSVARTYANQLNWIRQSDEFDVRFVAPRINWGDNQ